MPTTASSTEAHFGGTPTADITYGTNNEFRLRPSADNMAQDVSRHRAARISTTPSSTRVDNILVDEGHAAHHLRRGAGGSNLYMGCPAWLRQPDALNALRHQREGDGHRPHRGGHRLRGTQAERRQPLCTGSTSDMLPLSRTTPCVRSLPCDKGCIVRERGHHRGRGSPGRLMEGRRYSEGLHQAIEAKEGVKVQKESDDPGPSSPSRTSSSNAAG